MQLFKNARLLRSVAFASNIVASQRSVYFSAHRFFCQYQNNTNNFEEPSKINHMNVESHTPNQKNVTESND